MQITKLWFWRGSTRAFPDACRRWFAPMPDQGDTGSPADGRGCVGGQISCATRPRALCTRRQDGASAGTRARPNRADWCGAVSATSSSLRRNRRITWVRLRSSGAWSGASPKSINRFAIAKLRSYLPTRTKRTEGQAQDGRSAADVQATIRPGQMPLADRAHVKLALPETTRSWTPIILSSAIRSGVAAAD